jgi:segregation and condensation protein B
MTIDTEILAAGPHPVSSVRSPDEAAPTDDGLDPLDAGDDADVAERDPSAGQMLAPEPVGDGGLDPLDEADEAMIEAHAPSAAEPQVEPPPALAVDDIAMQVRVIEASIFASAEPVSENVLARRLPEGAALDPVMAQLTADYANRGVRLVRVGDAWAFRTASDVAPYLERQVDVSRKLSRAAIETLAIIAYHQPVTRAEIEEIRGVTISKGTLDLLFEHGWIRPKGRRRTPGRPVAWGTTVGFLDHFGLESLEDLPGVDELKAAGLLDARPAIEAYGVIDATGREEGLLPEPESEEGDEMIDPLDPEAP